MRALAFAATFGRNSVRSEASRVVGRADVEADLEAKRHEASASALPATRFRPLAVDWLDLPIQKTIDKCPQHAQAGTGSRPGPHTLRFLKSAQTLSPSPPGFVVSVALAMVGSATRVITRWRSVCSPARPHQPTQNSPSRATWCKPTATAARPVHHPSLHPDASPGPAKLAHPDAAT